MARTEEPITIKRYGNSRLYNASAGSYVSLQNIADLVKELAKNAVRHPNRRRSSLHDWQCDSQNARFDARMSEQALGWRPVADRDTMVARGITDAVTWYLR